MFKKALLIIFILFAVTLCACDGFGIEEAVDLDEEMHLSFNFLDDGLFEFQGNIYYLSHVNFLWGHEGDLKADGECEYLGWIGSRFWRKSHIFADIKEKPTFIYSTNTRSTYLNKNFDYKSETFFVEGTGDSFVFGEDLFEQEDKESELGNFPSKQIVIVSTNCSKLKARLYVFNENNEWYASSSNMVKFKLSDYLVDILDRNNLLYAC